MNIYCQIIMINGCIFIKKDYKQKCELQINGVPLLCMHRIHFIIYHLNSVYKVFLTP